MAASESVHGFVELLAALRDVSSVQKVGVSRDSFFVEVWVVFAQEDLVDMERVFFLERDLRRRAGMLRLNIHVISLDRVREENLPEMIMVFERQ